MKGKGLAAVARSQFLWPGIVGRTPNREGIDAACSDAIRAYKRLEFERIVPLFGLLSMSVLYLSVADQLNAPLSEQLQRCRCSEEL